MEIPVDGSCDARFAAVRDVFLEHFARHPEGGLPEVGAAIAVEIDGRSVVDLWAGWADGARTRPWEHDTIVCVFSCTKAAAALCALVLADRGELDLDAPAARYWPEFAAAGKDEVTVTHLLTHSAGLARLTTPLGPGGLWHWQTVTAALAAAEPEWEPGTAHGYHTLTFGHLVGEVVRRISGDDVATFWQRECASPLGVDLRIGLGAEDGARVATLLPPPESSSFGPVSAAARDIDAATIDRLDDPHILTVPVANSRPWREAQIPAANGHANARALARMWGAMATGGEGLLSAEMVEQAGTTVVAGPDRTIGVGTSFGLGWMTSDEERCFRPGSRCFWHGGAYGSLGHADPDARLGLGYVFNQCGEPQYDGRAARIVEALYDCLGTS